MTRPPAPFDPLAEFARIERLVSKLYYRFSHLFMNRPEIREFWWRMALDEEGHAAILLACKEMIPDCAKRPLDPAINREKAAELETKIRRYLDSGTPSISLAEAFRIALEIEGSEIDAVYGKLVNSAGPGLGYLFIEGLAAPAAEQKQRLKSALRRFSRDPELLSAAERL